MSDRSQRSTVRTALSILEPRDKYRLTVCFVFILISTVLEMASLGMVIPVVQAVVSGDERETYSWLPQWFKALDYAQFVNLLLVALVVAFLFKNLVLLLANYVQQRTQQSIVNRLAHRLFETYIRQPYEFHLLNASSSLVRNVQEYSSAVMGNGVNPLISLLTDVLTGIGLLLILIVVDVQGTLILLVLFGLGGTLIIGSTRRRLRQWGEDRLFHRGLQMEALLSGFGGIKEIKIFGRDREVLESHETSIFQAARSFYLFAVLQSVPRMFFELVAIIGVALLVLITNVRGERLQDTALVIALFGVVAFRLLPSVNRVIQSLQQLSYGGVAIKRAAESLELDRSIVVPTQSQRKEDFATLQVNGLRFRYPSSDRDIVKVDNLTVTAGETIGIVGPSGSGKSTLIDLLLGILRPSAGRIAVNGAEIKDDLRFWQDKIGYVPQSVFLLDASIRRNVAFGVPVGEINDSRVLRALQQAHLLDFVCSLPDGVETVIGERGVRMSGGQRQRLGIARALYSNPEVIVFDEATSSLDEATEREIVESLEEISSGRTMIIVTHRQTSLKYCARMIEISEGQIEYDGPHHSA